MYWIGRIKCFPHDTAYIRRGLPRDLNTVVFSLWAGFVPLMTSPSSANTSAWKQEIHNHVFLSARTLQRELITPHTSVILSRQSLESAMTDWPQRGWRRRTRPSLPLCCRRTPPRPSSTRRPAPASSACKLPPLLSNSRETQWEICRIQTTFFSTATTRKSTQNLSYEL